MFKCGLIVCAMCAMVGIASGAAVVIDDFEVGNPNLTSSAVAPPAVVVTATESGLTPTNVIGGVRKTTNSKNQGPAGQNVSAKIMDPSGPPVDNVIGLSTDTGGLIGEWKLEYGLAVAGTAPGDLTGGGTNNAIIFRFESADAGATVDMMADDGATSVTKTQLTLGPGNLTFAFASFTGVDFTSIDNLSFRVLGLVDGDYQISLVETNSETNVPEPFTMAALLMGLGGLGGYIRRRR